MNSADGKTDIYETESRFEEQISYNKYIVF